MFITELKAFRTDVNDVDALVELSAKAKMLRDEFERKQLPVPAWLDDTARQIAREIEAKVADQRAMRVREIQAELTNLESRDDKRARLREELDRLVATGEANQR